MSKELVVSATRHETRIAILEDDSVVEIFYQRDKEYSLAGSIHKGKVTRVLPGMQSAFVDIGLERDAFLYVSDFFEDNEEYDKVVSSVEEKVLKLEKVAPDRIPFERGTPAELSAPATDDVEVVAEASPGLTEPAAIEPAALEVKPAEARPDREVRGDGRDRGGRGRGRRGRRRRGGPPSGLPESKFYSPRKVDGDAEVETVAAIEPPEIPEEEDADFAVLPGESLAKYSSPEPRDEIMEMETLEIFEDHAAMDAQEEEEPAEHPVAPEPPPLPVNLEHHSHVYHSDPVVIEPPPLHVPAVEETPHLMETAPEPPPAPQPPAPEPPALPAEILPEPVVAAPFEPEAHLTAEPVAAPTEHATIHDSATNETHSEPFAETLIADSAIIEIREERDGSENDSAEAESAQLEAEAGADEPAVEDEGPEPARIPTSLTAALREQGNRFPHRLSRRARRKMRGGGPQGEHRNVAVAPPSSEVAEGTEPSLETQPPAIAVVAPEPSRPQRGRGDRPDRERSDRPDRERSERPERERSDRPERPPRAERTERPERTERSERTERPDRGDRPDRPVAPSISELLREGQEIIVQIAKEPLGQKGARITSHIALPGRFLVYMPTVDHVGVSRKIPSDEERQRLKRILQTNRTGMTGGFIVRTAGDGKTEEELRADMHFLYNLWLDIRQKAEKKPAPLLLHHDLTWSSASFATS